MSDYIPFQIQEEIIKRFPVKSLVQFRSVSKAWKGLIDSHEFIAAYSVRHNQPHHLLIRYEHMVESVMKYVSFVDDDRFPQQKFSPTVPLFIELLQDSLVVGSSGGLLCLYGTANAGANCKKKIVVLWNPSIRKSVEIDVPCVEDRSFETVLGFGVCPGTSDAKMVKITFFNIWRHNVVRQWESNNIIVWESNNIIVPWKVEVYTLSSGEWRTPSCNMPRHSIHVTWDQVVIDKVIYWHALDWIAVNDGFRTSNMIISFDMTTDEFREVYLPDSLAQPANKMIVVTISKVCESLVVLEYGMDADKRICDVWMIECDVPKSLTNLFTIKTPHASITTLGFRKSGEPIMTTLDDYYAKVEAPLVVYEPYSERINNIGISGTSRSFSMNSYMETLLLLNK